MVVFSIDYMEFAIPVAGCDVSEIMTMFDVIAVSLFLTF